MPSRSRLDMSDQKLGDALGFASTANFHFWLDGRLVTGMKTGDLTNQISQNS